MEIEANLCGLSYVPLKTFVKLAEDCTNFIQEEAIQRWEKQGEISPKTGYIQQGKPYRDSSGKWYISLHAVLF